jgi:hypothetical protein
MNNKQAQSTIEFAFAMVIVALLIFGLIKVFHWAGMDWAQKSYIRQNSTIFRPWTSIIEDDSGRTQRMVGYTHSF